MAQAATILTKTCDYCGAVIKYRMVPANRGQYWLVCPVCSKPIESFSDSQRYEILEYTSGGQTVTLIPITLTKTYYTADYRYYFFLTLADDPSYVATITDPNTGQKLDTVVGYIVTGWAQEPLTTFAKSFICPGGQKCTWVIRAVPDLTKVVEMRCPDGTLAGTATGYELVSHYCEPYQGQTPPPGQVIPTQPPPVTGGGGQGGGGGTTTTTSNLTKYLKYAGIAIAGLLGLLIIVRLLKGGEKKEEKK
jgi:hypothetical protein